MPRLTFVIEDILREISGQTDKAKFPQFDITKPLPRSAATSLEPYLAIQLATFENQLDAKIATSPAFDCLKSFILEFFNNARGSDVAATRLHIDVSYDLEKYGVQIIIQDDGKGFKENAFDHEIQQGQAQLAAVPDNKMEEHRVQQLSAAEKAREAKLSTYERVNEHLARERQLKLDVIHDALKSGKPINYDLIAAGNDKIKSSKVSGVGGQGKGLVLASAMLKAQQGQLLIGNSSENAPHGRIILKSPFAKVNLTPKASAGSENSLQGVTSDSQPTGDAHTPKASAKPEFYLLGSPKIIRHGSGGKLKIKKTDLTDCDDIVCELEPDEKATSQTEEPRSLSAPRLVSATGEATNAIGVTIANPANSTYTGAATAYATRAASALVPAAPKAAPTRRSVSAPPFFSNSAAQTPFQRITQGPSKRLKLK